MTVRLPPRLQAGARLAAVTLSWGGPGTFAHRYTAGKRQLESAFGVEVVEMPHTMADPAFVADNPQARAADLHAAFADRTIDGIVSTIGGDDSIRLLPHLDLDLIRTNPKVFVGYSDTTITHLACLRAGVQTFYGPAVMAGFGENAGLHDYLSLGVERMFSSEPPGRWPPNTEGWTVEQHDWANFSGSRACCSLDPAVSAPISITRTTRPSPRSSTMSRHCMSCRS